MMNVVVGYVFPRRRVMAHGLNGLDMDFSLVE